MAAPNVQPGDIFESRITGILNGQTTITSYNWVVGFGVPQGTGPNQVSDDLNTYMISANGPLFYFSTCAPTNWVCSNITSQRVGPKGVRSVQRSVPSTTAGVSGAASTSNLAQVITRRTDLAGRSQVSDIHIPCPTTSSTFTAGVLTTGQVGLLTAMGNNLLLPFIGTTSNVLLNPIIWHRVKGQVGGYDFITSFKVQTTVRTQRTRNVGIGI